MNHRLRNAFVALVTTTLLLGSASPSLAQPLGEAPVAPASAEVAPSKGDDKPLNSPAPRVEGSPTSPEQISPNPVVGDTAPQPLTVEQGEESARSSEPAAIAAAQFSPAGCIGKTDYAHWTQSYAVDMAAVHGRTNCNVPVFEVGVTTHLQHLAWFGWNTVKSDTSFDSNSAKSQDAHPHSECASTSLNKFRGVSSHWSQEGPTRYTASTTGVEREFAC